MPNKRTRSKKTKRKKLTQAERELMVVKAFFSGTPERQAWARGEIRKMGGSVWQTDLAEDEQGQKFLIKRPSAKVVDISKKR